MSDGPVAVRTTGLDLVRHHPRTRRARWVDTLLRLLVAGAAGGVYLLAFAPHDWWAAALLAMALVAWAGLGAGLWWGAAVGAVFGLAFWLGHIGWLTAYLGPVPWLALALAMTAFSALGVALAGFVTRRQLARQTHPALVAAAWAVIWTGREVTFSRLPYGGFAWGSVAASQADAPTVGLSSWLGLSGLTLAVVLACTLPVTWLLARRPLRRPAVMGVILLVAALIMPAWGAVAPATGTLRVAAVQGNADAGLFSNAEPGEILRNHLDAARSIMHDDFDVMVWPENAVDVDVLRSTQVDQAITDFVDDMGRPLVFGSVTQRGDDVYNTVLLWLPSGWRTGDVADPEVAGSSGDAGQPAQVYDKRHPVPFAEYMPDRWLFHPLAPDLVDLVPRGFTFGARSGVFDIPLDAASASGEGDATVPAGVLICFETSDTDLVHDVVGGGAQILLAPTNNADFGRTPESAQQLQIARVNAVAAGRSLVNISTVSSSALVAEDGTVMDTLPDFTAGTMIADLPLQSGRAPSWWTGPIVQWGSVVATVLLVITTALARRNERRRARASDR